jgi:hypothetical protein
MSSTYLVTVAGKQIERALSQGYVTAAFNLYLDAITNDVTLVQGEGAAEWHHRMQADIEFPAVADMLDEDEENGSPVEPPLRRDAGGRVTMVNLP